MKDTEAKKNLLKVLIPNQKARVFVTEVLSQSTQNFGDMLINQERNQENNTIGSFKSPLQEGYPGNLTDVIGHKNEYNQNENAPSFVFITSKTKSLIYSLEMIHDDKDKNKVVGAKVIAIMPYSATNRALFDLGDNLCNLYHKKEVIIDLQDINNPIISSIQTDYSGEPFGFELPDR